MWQVLDQSVRDQIPSTVRWFTTLTQHNSFKSTLGPISMAATSHVPAHARCRNSPAHPMSLHRNIATLRLASAFHHHLRYATDKHNNGRDIDHEPWSTSSQDHSLDARHACSAVIIIRNRSS